MITTVAEGRHFHITGDTPAIIQADLGAAVDMVKTHAIQERAHGILVTQHGPGTYTVAMSPEVPYGRTLEKRDPGFRAQTRSSDAASTTPSRD
ncbi:hypothetical protein ACSBOX_17715 [Arthrobacter sp. KN11-1C]|uniref:hypothetical protein n=1 Tax=Arthrobacter sp. KN11-1C TaxID=3445774 RepID=UPI003F9F9272